MAENNNNNQNEQNTNTNTNGNGGNNTEPNGNGGNNQTYTQEQLDSIVNDRSARATKSALKSFFSQKGLTEEEATQAMNEYLDNKKKNTPDVAQLQSTIEAEKTARQTAEINTQAVLEATKQGVDTKAIPYILKLADFSNCIKDGNIDNEMLSQAIKKVTDDIPGFKADSNNDNNSVRKIGGDGSNTNNKNTNSNQNKSIPTKKWNRFNY